MKPDEHQPKPKEPSVEEKVGRTLGKAFGRLKRTRIWKDTAKAYRKGLEGKR